MSRTNTIKGKPENNEGLTEQKESILDQVASKSDKDKSNYRSFKIQNTVYERFEKLAKDKQKRYPGEIIHVVLKNWLDKNGY